VPLGRENGGAFDRAFVMPFDRNLLFYFVRDALAPYSENFHIIDRMNPVRVDLNGSPFSIHVSYVHDSGNARDNEDEVRIQLGRGLINTQRERQTHGQKVAFIGFFEGGETFVAWDPRHVFSLQTSTLASVYARQSQRIYVAQRQVAVHKFRARMLGEQSFAIALPSSALGFYLENIARFHALPSEDAIVSLVEQHTEIFDDTGRGKSGEFVIDTGVAREKFIFERTAYPRDPRFKKAVLEAYAHTCCVCGRQLGIVQAAHIIPHSVESSPNQVTNGLALCIEHHRLYDDALLLPGPGYRLVFNEQRAEYLRQTKQEKGLEEVKNFHGHRFNVPEKPDNRPDDDFLRQGVQYRVGGSSI
jgi:putative restriction endonuclease